MQIDDSLMKRKIDNRMLTIWFSGTGEDTLKAFHNVCESYLKVLPMSVNFCVAPFKNLSFIEMGPWHPEYNLELK